MIDLKRCQLVVNVHPTYAIDHRVTTYYTDRGMPISNIIAANCPCGYIEGRNRIIRDWIIPVGQKYEWSILMDKDVIPIAGLTDRFLDDVPADLVACMYETDNQQAWLTQEDIHWGICRVRPQVFTQITPPWSMFKYSEDGCSIVACDCNYFKTKALEAGFKITRRGWAKHEASIKSWHNSA